MYLLLAVCKTVFSVSPLSVVFCISFVSYLFPVVEISATLLIIVTFFTFLSVDQSLLLRGLYHPSLRSFSLHLSSYLSISLLYLSFSLLCLRIYLHLSIFNLTISSLSFFNPSLCLLCKKRTSSSSSSSPVRAFAFSSSLSSSCSHIHSPSLSLSFPLLFFFLFFLLSSARIFSKASRERLAQCAPVPPPLSSSFFSTYLSISL